MSIGRVLQGIGVNPLGAVCTLVLLLQTASAQTLIVSPTNLNFTATADSVSVPPQQAVQITSANGASIDFAFQGALGDFGAKADYIYVTPVTGTTPATVMVGLSAAGVAKLAPGLYGIDLEFGSGSPPVIPFALVRVLLTVNQPPGAVADSLVNAATLQSGIIAPAEVVSVFGNHIGPLYDMTTVPVIIGSSQQYFPTASAGTSVTFNGIKAPILYASSDQINAVVPAALAGAVSADVVVTRYGQSSAPLHLTVAETSPGILTLSRDGNGQAVILNTDNSVNTVDHPAPRGSIVQMFGTGGGLFSQKYSDGYILNISPPYPAPIAPVSVSIGGRNATVTYAGPAPGLVFGVLQVNAVVPQDVASGAQPVVLKVGANTNNQKVTLTVQ